MLLFLCSYSSTPRINQLFSTSLTFVLLHFCFFDSLIPKKYLSTGNAPYSVAVFYGTMIMVYGTYINLILPLATYGPMPPFSLVIFSIVAHQPALLSFAHVRSHLITSTHRSINGPLFNLTFAFLTWGSFYYFFKVRAGFRPIAFEINIDFMPCNTSGTVP